MKEVTYNEFLKFKEITNSSLTSLQQQLRQREEFDASDIYKELEESKQYFDNKVENIKVYDRQVILYRKTISSVPAAPLIGLSLEAALQLYNWSLTYTSQGEWYQCIVVVDGKTNIIIESGEVLPVNKSSNGSNSNGLSAYEIAVKNGYRGTEIQWLASLRGEPGKDGQMSQSQINEIIQQVQSESNGYSKSEINSLLSAYNPTNNFKTINNSSIIGVGNISITGTGGSDSYDHGYLQNQIDELERRINNLGPGSGDGYDHSQLENDINNLSARIDALDEGGSSIVVDPNNNNFTDKDGKIITLVLNQGVLGLTKYSKPIFSLNPVNASSKTISVEYNSNTAQTLTVSNQFTASYTGSASDINSIKVGVGTSSSVTANQTMSGTSQTFGSGSQTITLNGPFTTTKTASTPTVYYAKLDANYKTASGTATTESKTANNNATLTVNTWKRFVYANKEITSSNWSTCTYGQSKPSTVTISAGKPCIAVPSEWGTPKFKWQGYDDTSWERVGNISVYGTSDYVVYKYNRDTDAQFTWSISF